MTQKEKELLVKDLTARLSYGVKAQVKYPINTNGKCAITTKEITSVNCGLDMIQAENIDIIVGYYTFEVKPYLFPMSSMTDEQKEEFDRLYTFDALIIEPQWELIDWLNKNHFDYRGLIPMGLALDATGLNVY